MEVSRIIRLSIGRGESGRRTVAPPIEAVTYTGGTARVGLKFRADIMMTMAFDVEQKYYDEHKAELLQHHAGKYVLIVKGQLVGVFDRQEDAYSAGISQFGNVPLFIKRVTADDPPVSIPAMTLGLIGAHP
jgi:hypothetical protein